MIFFKQYGDLEFWFSSQIALTVKVNCWKYLCGNCFEKWKWQISELSMGNFCYTKDRVLLWDS